MSKGQIHLWATFLAEAADETLLSQYRCLLTDEERQQEPRFYFLRDRNRYVVTRALVRTTLSRYADIPPEQWVFTKNEYGKPEIANDPALARTLRFNVTHTAGLVAISIAHEHEIGVDAESLTARAPPLEIADRYFAPDEATALRALPPERQPERFMHLWTLKESYIKARGIGLSLPLAQFGFRFAASGSLEFWTSAELQDAAERWRFWQFKLGAEHVLALCAEKSGDTPPHLLLREAVPLVSERVLELAPARASA